MRKLLSILLAVIMLTASFNVPVSAAELNKNEYYNNKEEGELFEEYDNIYLEYIDAEKFFAGANDESNPKKQDGIFLKNVIINYCVDEMKISLKATIHDKSDKAILGDGIVYNREHVNYEVCYLVDMLLEQAEYTIVYFELFREKDVDYFRIYVENNISGNMFSAVVQINSAILEEIERTASDNKMTENQYLDLVTFNKKSPNHALIRNESTVVFQDPYKNIAEGNEDDMSLMPKTSMLNSWLNLLSAQKNNSSLNYTNYSVDQDFFDSLNTTAGQAQWRTYSSSPSYDYRVVRCAYYQAFSGTYTFYYALVRPRGTYSGDIITFNYGFVDFPNTTQPDSYSYRVELNKNTHTMRYVADYGLKFQPTLHLSIDSGSFVNVTCGAQIQNVSNARNIAMFAIGLIPHGIGTGLSIIDLILQYGSEVAQAPNATRIWTKSAGDSDVRDAVISFLDTSVYVYKPHDQMFIYAEKTGSPTVYYSWSYSVTV